MYGKPAWYLPVGIEQRALAGLAQAWHLARSVGNVWPGWDLRQWPLALYRRDGSCFLAGHPRPPRAAREVFWPAGAEGPPVYRVTGLPDGLTGGSAVLAYQGAVTAFVPVEWVGDTVAQAVEYVALLWREGFRAYLHAAGKAAGLRLSGAYPDDHPVNNALGNIEGRLLLAARQAEGEEAVRRLALEFALIRRERRAQLEDELIDYERAVEYESGLATYVSMGALDAAMGGDPPCPGFQRLLGEESLADLAARLGNRYMAELAAVNRLGRGAARRRFFFTGMGLAFLLDRVHPGWQRCVHRPDAWLDTLLEGRVTFDGGAGDDAVIAEAEYRYGYVDLLEEERAAARRIRERKQRLMEDILCGNGTMFVFDVSHLRLTESRLDHDGLETISERLRVHTGSAFFQYGQTTLYFNGVPVVEDRASGLLEVRVPGSRLRISGDNAAFGLVKPAEFTEGFELNVGGVRVRAQRGVIHPIDGAIYVKITR